MKRLGLFVAMMLLMVGLFAQAPEKMTYQAVVRDNNQLVANANVGVRISVLQGSVTGSPVFIETHVASTNANGLMTLIIGEGTVVSGDFSAIDWGNGPYFLKTETDPTGGSNYTIEGTQQLMSVPYALYAKNAGNSFSGDYNDLTNKPNLSNVATSGNYNDLSNTPTIPTVPSNVSAFNNDAGYITSAAVPTNVSQLNNDANYITANDVPAQVNSDWNATGGTAQILNKPNLSAVATSGNYNDLSNKPNIPTVPTNVSAFTNDRGYITAGSIPTNVSAFANDRGYITAADIPAQVNSDWNATSGSAQILNKPNLSPVATSGNYNDLNNKPNLSNVATSGNYNDLSNTPNLSNVATSGSYNDLSNTPTIPRVPTNVSEFNNDAGYITTAAIPTQVSAFNNDAGYITSAAVPTNVSQLNNDANYITANDVPAQVNADWNATEGAAQILNKPNLSTVATSGNYNDLNNKPNLANVATSGNYNDLSNTPTIPRVPTNVSEFTNDANYITSAAIPTNVSAFNNDAGYLTSSAVPTNVSQLNNDANYITSAAIPTNVSAFNNDRGYLTSYTEQQILTMSNDTIYLTGGSFVKLPAGFDGDYNSLTNKPNLANVATSGNYNDLTNKPNLFSGDYNDLNNKPNLANVATSGNYNDLSNTPTIPTVPSNVSEFNNDAGYITSSAVPTNVSQLNNDANYITSAAIPTNVSAFNNDRGYLTSYTEQQILTISNDTIYLTGGSFVKLPAGFDGDYNSLNNKPNLANVATSGNYNDLSNTPTIPTVPTNVSDFNNDAGYITTAAVPTNVSAFNNDRGYLTSYTEQQILTMSNDTIYLTGGSFVKLPAGFDGDYNSLTNKPNLANVATSGNYNDLSNTPTIPRIPTNVSEFNNDANYITSAAIPTQVSAFTNDAGYITSSAVPTNVSQLNNDANYITANDVPAQVNADWNATEGAAKILNKPNLSTVATSGNYNDLNNKPNLANVATSGSYNDLSNTPTIPRVPTNVSEFNNDANYITSAAIPTQVSAFTNDAGYITSSAVPTNVSQLNNDAGYITNDSCSELSFCDLAAQIALLQHIIDSLTHTLAIDPPTVSTNAISSITQNSAIGGGNVTASGGGNITARGVCWSTNHYPTISDSHTTDGTGTGSYTSSLTGLTAGATYYVRAYATNIAGTAYGAQQSFTTTAASFNCGTATVSDYDGNVYNTVQIGNQCWMKQNLRTTHYANGTSISLGSSTSTSTTTAYRYCHNNDASNVATYGYLYNWKAVMCNSSSSNSNPSGVQGICPNGWHVPSEAEWKQLTNYVSNQIQYVCESTSTNIAKALASTTGWNTYSGTCCVGNNPSTNNATGFSAVPAGYYTGSYSGFGNATAFWSSTEYGSDEAYDRNLDYNLANVIRSTLEKYYGLSVRCLRDEGPTVSLPTVSTTAVSGIADTTATSGGNVTADGGATVTARGVCWSTSENPTIADSHTTDGTGTGSFTSNLTGLTAYTTYYVRAYATNSVGTAYGAQQSFTTTAADDQPCPGAATLTDVDGNVYNTVQIGSQCWMKENLKTTHYADGTSISLGSSASTTTTTTTAYRYCPNNDASNVATYGYLYNWKAVMHNSSSSNNNPSGVQGICPNGWHVPSNAEWTQLTNYVRSQSQYVCGSTSSLIAKALASTTGWNSYTSTCAVGNDPSTNNATGFSAVPAGYYNGSYNNFGNRAYFWSSTEISSNYAFYRSLYCNSPSVSSGNYYSGLGFSVRCLRD